MDRAKDSIQVQLVEPMSLLGLRMGVWVTDRSIYNQEVPWVVYRQLPHGVLFASYVEGIGLLGRGRSQEALREALYKTRHPPPPLWQQSQ